jgi:hypothetical protein
VKTMELTPTVVVFSDVLDVLMPSGVPLSPEDVQRLASLEAQGVTLVRVSEDGASVIVPGGAGTATPAQASGYSDSVNCMRQLLARGDAPLLTAGLTDPTKPRNLLALVDRSICVSRDDARAAGLRVSDWVAAIADLAEQMRSKSVPPPVGRAES